MFQPNHHKLHLSAKPLATQDQTTAVQHGTQDSCVMPMEETQNRAVSQAEAVVHASMKLQDDLQMLGLKIKEHEEHIKELKSQRNNLDGSILDTQVKLGRYHSSSTTMVEADDHAQGGTELATVEHIIRHEKSAAGIFCLLKARHSSQISHLPLTKDILGIVATLGKVDDDNLSRLLAEYLGLQTMLAVVCKTYDGVRALETYEKDGSVIKGSGLQGLASSIGRQLDGRYLVICLENLRPYSGEFVTDDPQKRLDLMKPRLANGEFPPGFVGFAVNMINIDNVNLFCLTANGQGLRETLFYNLFSRLQVYRTRTEMLQALPCISDGAVSLDGGMLKSTGMFYLGKRGNIDVTFPKSSGMSKLPVNYLETERRLKEMKWKKERLLEDVQREEALLKHAKSNFESKKQEFVKFLAESSSYMTQNHAQAGRDRLTPR